MNRNGGKQEKGFKPRIEFQPESQKENRSSTQSLKLRETKAVFKMKNHHEMEGNFEQWQNPNRIVICCEKKKIEIQR